MTREPNQEATGGRRGFFATPSTKLGRWSVLFAATFIVLMGINGAVFMRLPGEPDGYLRVLLVVFGLAMVACGLAAGILGLMALVLKQERSWLVWLLPILAGLYVVFLLVGEVLFPH